MELLKQGHQRSSDELQQSGLRNDEVKRLADFVALLIKIDTQTDKSVNED